MRRASLIIVWTLVWASHAIAQQTAPPCRVLCAPELKVEPTITVTNLIRAPRVASDAGVPTRERRHTEFEIILSLDIPTRLPRVGVTVEAIFLPFDRDSTPELEFETNLTWLSGERTGGWVSSHFDVVDKFSPAQRPTDRRASPHKLNLELHTRLPVFNRLPEDRWLRGVEVEASLDYVATGLSRAGDRAEDHRFLDDASPWSLSIVFVLPIAPF